MKNLILIRCTDEVGLVYRITGILSQSGLNITTMREYVNGDTRHFFTRIECDGDLASREDLSQQLATALPSDAEIIVNPAPVKRIVVLVTKEHHCLGDILTRNYFGTLKAEVLAVAGNYDNLRDFTTRFGIPYHYVTHEGKSRQQFETELMEVIDQYNPDYTVLAKFMRILSPEFVARYEHKLINIHHSFLPAFIGANPYRQAYERGVKLIGATAHYVTNDLDDGPIIAQLTQRVNHTHSAQDMMQFGRETEKSVLSQGLRLVFEDRVFVTGNKTIVFN